MDLFQLALSGKYNQMYEYYLVGSVLDEHKEGFIEILRGLCDNPEAKPIEFAETEVIYTAVNNNGMSVSLRARHNMENDPNGLSYPPYCHLRYIGQTDFKLDKERKSMVRNYIDCMTTINLAEYLTVLGFNIEARILIKGFMFHKGRLKIVVSKLHAHGNESQPLTRSSLVEISCVVSSASQESIADEVKRFADMLKPYVRMDKMHQITEELNV